MLTRFTSWLAIGIAAAFLVVAGASFAASATMWLTFAIAIGTLLISIGIGVGYRKHVPTAATAAVTTILSGWMIVSSLLFSLSVVSALSFAGALGLAALSTIGLTINELAREHVVHTLATTTTVGAQTGNPQTGNHHSALVG
jgi:hypothetical protein